MRRNKSWMAGLAVLLTATLLGCSPATDEKESTSGDQNATTEAEQTAAAEAAKQEKTAPEPPPKPTMPEVKLTDALAATCLIKVGDTMPEATLPDLKGKATELRSLRGEKLTVVCFWKGDHLYALEELRELEKSVAGPYGEKGIRVIGINEGETPAAAAEKLELTGATFANLSDPNGAYFLKVATEKLPRTYLLDAQGKVLWFDIEYSQSTRRDLLQGIQVALGEI